jgi:hypothetical protein
MYYDKLALITRGALWSWDRLVEVLKMNLGFYGSLVDRYKYRYPDQLLVSISDLQRTVQNAPSLNGERCLGLPESGIRIKLDRLSHAPRIGLKLDHDDSYTLVFYRAEKEAASLDIPMLRRKTGGMSLRLADVPRQALEVGYDAIALLPARVEKTCCIGGVAFLN